MAKYYVNYCCGHGQREVELFGKSKDRERKIEWMEENMLCPECYKAEQKEMGITLQVNIDPYNKDYPIVLVFTGDTYAHKDEIKGLGGYRWGDRPSTGMLGIFDFKSEKAWHKHIEANAIDEEIKNAKEIGAEITNNISALDIIALKERIKGEKEVKQ